MKAVEQEYFRRAFELAYFIHPKMEVALRVAEAAVCKLDYTFGRQGRRVHYVPSGRGPNGGGLSHALRTKINLKEEHLLQLLVYAESDFWERSSEYAGTPLPVTEEDMVIRFIKHLVQITLKRNSFYVTLGIGRLLYDYDTSQVRQMYDVLMQDQARFRDNSYLRKQKNVLIRELLSRFSQKIRTVRTPQREIRFVTQPRTEPLRNLVRACLMRFNLWETACVIPAVFDPTEKIAALLFSGADPDQEAPIETNRIHTVIDPECFQRLVVNLGFAAPDDRLAVPRFFLSEEDSTPGDRFNPPALSEREQTRLKHARKENAQRRKAYRAGRFSVYVDEIRQAAFDPQRTSSVKLEVTTDAKVIEVRGNDLNGEFTLAILLVPSNIPREGYLEDAVTLEGGQEVTILLTPSGESGRAAKGLTVEVSYAETYPTRAMRLAARRIWHVITGRSDGSSKKSEQYDPVYGWLLLAAVSLVLVVGAFVLVWWRTRPLPVDTPQGSRTEKLPTPPVEISPSPRSVPSRVPTPSSPAHQIVRVTWIHDARALDNAIRLETRRGGEPSIDIGNTPTVLRLAVNRLDAEEQKYLRYRLILTAGEGSIYEQVLQPPRPLANSRAYVLSVALTPERFPKADSYKLRIDGETQRGWQGVGQIVLQVAGK
ncbi:MAG TPA: hypothetical protein VJS64_10390 [Pyrinomonadaceae bacterium]|nr:hypothetical protein [Pyrinomonadaceae bacterium]